MSKDSYELILLPTVPDQQEAAETGPAVYGISSLFSGTTAGQNVLCKGTAAHATPGLLS